MTEKKNILEVKKIFFLQQTIPIAPLGISVTLLILFIIFVHKFG